MASSFSRWVAGLRLLASGLGLGSGGLAGLVLMRDETDRPFRWIGRDHQLAQGLKHLLELGTGVAAEGVMRHGQRFGLVLQLDG